MNKSEERQRILKKIEEYERNGYFDRDVEDDPPTRTLQADEIDYIKTSLWDKCKRRATFFLARKFIKKLIKQNQFILEEIKGIEHFNALTSGALITCNHFSPLDSFAMQLTHEKSIFKRKKNKKLYRVIREGNYTNFSGFYGKLMRNCDTLPLSSSTKTMIKFMKSCTELLAKGNFILVYPEESLWWNYKKPKPLKPGAFQLAVKNNVPVLPVFITMKETEHTDADGFPVLAYTVNIDAPIFPDETLSKTENIEAMKNKNFAIWKRVYEEVYKQKLVYLQPKEEHTLV